MQAALDLYTAGGEVLAGAGPFPPSMAATEPWPPNVAHSHQAAAIRSGAVVVDTSSQTTPLPFGDAAFDLVTSRHPSARLLGRDRPSAPTGRRLLRPARRSYLAADAGRALCGTPSPPSASVGSSDPDTVREEITGSGLEIVDLRHEVIRMEFFDVGAVIYFLRKLTWVVPDFTVTGYHDKLLDLHQLIEAEGLFVTHSSRILVDARKMG